jgi:DNA modification methylase
LSGWRLIEGDCREVLRSLDAESVQTCVTSPPYFGLRDYGHDGQLGLEPTPDEYVAALVEAFREVRRVLRDDGTLWLNLGDSYANDAKWGGSSGGKHVMDGQTGGEGYRLRRATGLKSKDLIGVPWRVAFALQADGWYLRSDIIWAKPNPMPESVTDRPTKAHEYLFLLAKAPRYYYDADAMREDGAGRLGLRQHEHASRRAAGDARPLEGRRKGRS